MSIITSNKSCPFTLRQAAAICNVGSAPAQFRLSITVTGLPTEARADYVRVTYDQYYEHSDVDCGD